MHSFHRLAEQAGVHRVDRLSPNLSAKFSLRKFRSAEVCWINERWFLDIGVDAIGSDRDLVRQWLLDEFAYGVPRPSWDHEPDEFYLKTTRTMQADRYGGPGGTPHHGGSGRCAIAGSFNAKGIGATPLVGNTADWYHAHGCMWLEEAIREAILSEIACAEFPHGAVPTIAVIRINDIHHRKDGSAEPMRAILVRPNFIRPAHFERSIFFGGAGSEDSPQYIDSLRTRESVQSFCQSVGGDHPLNLLTKGISDTFVRIGEQIGFGWAHRLFHGGYFSSNITVDGQLVDFGSFRSMPSWHRAATVTGAAPFGSEVDSLSPILSSLAFYFGKYGDAANQLMDVRDAHATVMSVARRSFESACRQALILNINCSRELKIHAEAQELLNGYFQEQQVVSFNHLAGERPPVADWLYPALFGRGTRENGSDRAASQLIAILSSDAAKGGQLGRMRAATRIANAARWLRPRPLIVREKLSRIIELACRRMPPQLGGAESMTHKVIAGVVARSRRHWPKLPEGLQILSQASNGYSSALTCVDVHKRQRLIHLEGAMCKDELCLFDARIPMKAVQDAGGSVNVMGRSASFQVVPPAGTSSRDTYLNIAGFSLVIPTPDLIYRNPAVSGP